MTLQRPFIQAADNNRAPISDVLTRLFRDCCRLLEIGSGTGQHAAFIGPMMPWLLWQTTDLAEALPGIQMWLDAAEEGAVADDEANTQPDGQSYCFPPALSLDVGQARDWYRIKSRYQAGFDAAFSANTAHIMDWANVEAMFWNLGEILVEGAVFALYGPFNRRGQYTSEGNKRFDAQLRRQNPHMGIRDDRSMYELAGSAGFRHQDDIAMPANNRILVFARC